LGSGGGNWFYRKDKKQSSTPAKEVFMNRRELMTGPSLSLPTQHSPLYHSLQYPLTPYYVLATYSALYNILSPPTISGTSSINLLSIYHNMSQTSG
jgi:hypothetical protein